MAPLRLYFLLTNGWKLGGREDFLAATLGSAPFSCHIRTIVQLCDVKNNKKIRAKVVSPRAWSLAGRVKCEPSRAKWAQEANLDLTALVAAAVVA